MSRVFTRTDHPMLDWLLAALVGTTGLAFIAALTLTDTPAQAAFPGTNGAIACGGLRGLDVDLEIFQVNPDGSGEILQTDNGFRDGSPAFSPDGSRIAFESQRDNVLGQPANTEIYVADNDGDLTGSDVKRLTFNTGRLTNSTLSGIAATDFSPSWSPDGTQIVFHSGRVADFDDGGPTPAADFEIYKMSATTGESTAPATRLTTNRGQDAIPSWSPDGTKIAFQGFPAGNPATLNNNLEIFTINPDGTERTNLTNSPGTPNNPATAANENLDGLDRDVIWSPDSRQLAFNSARASAVLGNQNNDVWRMNRDGGNPVRLTVNADTPTPEPFRDYDAPLVWSPDNNEILFASSRSSPDAETTDFLAYRMSAATGDAGGVRPVARVEQFQRCDWTSRAVTRPTPVPPATPPPAPLPPGRPAPPIVDGGVVAPDTTAPRLTLTGIPRSITRAKLLKSGLSVRVASSEAAGLRGELQATARRGAVAEPRARAAGPRYALTLATKVLPLARGSRTLKLRPSAALFGRPRGTVTLRVRVEGRDVSANRGTVTRTLKVRPR